MMKERIRRRNYSIWAFDVESHADEESVEAKKTGVWLASFINDESKIDDEANFFYDLDSWLDRLDELTKKKKVKHRKGEVTTPNNLCIYVFNFAFEYSFILPVILKRGFKYKEKIEDEDEYVFNAISTKTCSSVWQCEMKFGKKQGRIIFRDLCKIYPSSLRALAASFGLETQKGDIDYKLNRLHGYVPTKEEKDYNFKDTRIIIEILQILRERGDREFWSSVSAASYSCKKMLKHAFPKAHFPLKAYRRIYPQLEEAEDEFLRRGVAGGLTYAPERWQFVEIEGEIGHIDFHQSHPSRMASMHGEVFPFGKGMYGKGEPIDNPSLIFCCRVRVSYSGVRLHSVIRLIGIDCIDDFELTLWDFEIETMKKAYYDLRVEYLDYYAYKYRYLPFREYFKENYRERLEAKRKGDKFEVFYRKLLNNSAYGKFLERAHAETFENFINEEGQIDSIIHEKESPSYGTYTYVPVGSCIPAYSRCALIEAGLALSPETTLPDGTHYEAGHFILYMDTDSLFFAWNDITRKGIESLAISEELGDFGFEEDLSQAQFTAAKRYKLVHAEDGVVEVKAGGVTLEDDLIYDETNLVNGLFSAHTKMRVEGGTLIIDRAKQLSVQPKYKATYLRNAGIVYNTRG